MEGRGRRQAPLEPFRAVPDLALGLLSATNALDDDVEEQQPADAEGKSADARDQVPVGELNRVVRYAPRHAGEAQEVLREEQHVDPHHRPPEVNLGQFFVVHVAGPLGQPVENRRDDREQGTGDEHIVEMGHHEVGVVVLEVSRDILGGKIHHRQGTSM